MLKKRFSLVMTLLIFLVSSTTSLAAAPDLFENSDQVSYYPLKRNSCLRSCTLYFALDTPNTSFYEGIVSTYHPVDSISASMEIWSLDDDGFYSLVYIDTHFASQEDELIFNKLNIRTYPSKYYAALVDCTVMHPECNSTEGISISTKFLRWFDA